ncbi:MAG TPA: hypothetical protein VHD14_17655 [Pseudolabrys sp.]|nr:hypothetical protein [Pseudolabrys sp.]
MDVSAQTRRVLIVEDEYLIRMLLADMLEEHGSTPAASPRVPAKARTRASDADVTVRD